MRNNIVPTSYETPVSELMTADLVTIETSDTVGRARDLMVGLGVHALPVLEDGVAVGIVTSADLVEEWPAGEPLTTMMSRSVRLVEPTATASEAAAIMRDDRIHHLVVVEGATPVGILSTFDLLQVLSDAR